RSDSFLEKPEIMIATSYLKALEDNRDDISLVALLRSPLYCVNERELAFLRTLQHGSFYGLIYRFRNEHETEEGRSMLENAAEELGLESGFIETLNKKLDKFAEEFEMLSSLAYTTSPSDLVNFILSETDIVSVFSAMPQGSGRRANLNGLAGCVRELEDSGLTSLSEINEALDGDSTLDEVNENVDENVVTFTTIHGSKGLEFPVVFLSEAQSRSKSNEGAAVIRRDGLFFKSLKIEELEDGIRDYTTDNTLLKAAGLSDEEEEEKKRLLYVAMTRAEQSLQVMAYDTRKNQTKSFLDLICAAKGDEKPEFTAPCFEKSEEAGNSVVPDDPAFDGERKSLEVSDADLISPATAVKKMFSKTGGVTCSNMHYKGEEETEDERVPADVLGTAVHLIFERTDLGRATKAEVEKTAEELCRKGFFSESVLEVIKDTFIDGIAALYRTKTGKELRQSEDVRREFPITVLVNAEPEEGSDDYTIVHGVIDAMYRNPDGRWVLIDYKTDVNLSREKVLKENYDGQLRLYAKALEKMGEQVESCYLYGVRHHDLFKVEKED
uniref:3'-5' exonuclease n=1 Tax=Ligilactobacillus sp. TaxID=2767921 RepID=UPI002FDF1E62